MPLAGVRAPGRRARSQAASGSQEPTARWLQGPGAGCRGALALGAPSPGDASRGPAAPLGLRAARSHSPHLRRCSGCRSDGASRVRSPPALQPLPARHMRQPVRARLSPGAAPFRGAARLPPPPPPTPGAGGRAGSWSPGAGLLCSGGIRPAPLPPPGSLRNLLAPGAGAQPRGWERGRVCGVLPAPPRGLHPPPEHTPLPLSFGIGSPPPHAHPGARRSAASKHPACGDSEARSQLEGTWGDP